MINISTTTRLFAISVGGTIAFTVTGVNSAQAATFSGVYTFGDSLSDPGNLFESTLGYYPPSSIYSEGRFSNGKVWVNYLTEKLGLNPTRFVDSTSSAEGVNYAFGGATTGYENRIPPFPGLTAQVQSFIAPLLVNNQTADSDALYILWAGGNDYTLAGVQNPYQPVNNIRIAVESLFNYGARNFLVANLPDLSKTPLVRSYDPVIANGLQTLVNIHNNLLETSIQGLNQSLTGAKVSFFDTYSLVNNVIANPQAFGFTNVTDSCLPLPIDLKVTPIPCTNPDQYLFWDDFHPTTQGHQVLANAAYSQIKKDFKPVPEPGTVFALSGLGLGLLIQKRLKKAG